MSSCGGASSKLDKDPKQITKEEWKKVLTPEQFHITQEAGTEPKGTGKLDNFFKPGNYNCICCGCGWPAFDESVGNDKNIIRLEDNSYGYLRTEVRCKNCNAHLGHVFDDGPKNTTGQRYCINSCAIGFFPAPPKQDK